MNEVPRDGAHRSQFLPNVRGIIGDVPRFRAMNERSQLTDSGISTWTLPNAQPGGIQPNS